MDIEKMRMFAAVADCLNFTKAAERLYISQPTLSRHISDLEEQMGVELFIRTTRTVSLTAAGRVFKAEAKQILDKYESMLGRIQNLKSGASGVIRVGSQELFAQNILPAAIQSFSKHFESVELQLMEMRNDEVLSALRDGIVDVGLMLLRTPKVADLDPELDSVCLRVGGMRVITNPEHEWAGRRSITPAMLRGRDILTFDSSISEPLRAEIASLCIPEGFAPRFVIGNNNPGALFLQVRCGLGISIMSSLVTSVLYLSEDLHVMELEGCSFRQYLHLVWRRDTENSCLFNFVEEVSRAGAVVREQLGEPDSEQD